MGVIDNRRPATLEQIEKMKETLMLTLESSYHELYVDMVLMEGLNRGFVDNIENLDKDYIDKVLRVHSNVCYANLCLCVQMRASLKATLGVEKQYVIRRSVVTAHEIYKYLYGFTGRPTLWSVIESRLQQTYPEMCKEIADAADKYMKGFAQEEDGNTRDIAKHYSNDTEEFFEQMSFVNERRETDRILALMKYLQPIHLLLVEELRNQLGLVYLVLWNIPMPKQEFEVSRVIKHKRMDDLKYGLAHYDGIVNGLYRRIRVSKEIASQHNIDISHINDWSFMVNDNILVHILYIFLDITSTYLAILHSETYVEFQQNLAYMFLSAHEGFKKLYGFIPEKRNNSFWYRSVKAELEEQGDNTLSDEVKEIEERLNQLSKSDYLKDDEMAVVFSHFETNKKTGKENAVLVLDYFRKPENQEHLKVLTDFLFVLNDIVHLENKVFAIHSAEKSQEIFKKLEHYRQMLAEFETTIDKNVKDTEIVEGFHESLRSFRSLFDNIEMMVKE